MNARENAYAALAATRPRVEVAGDVVAYFMARLIAQGGHCSHVADEAQARVWLATLAAAETQLLRTDDAWLDQVLSLPGPALPPRTSATTAGIEGMAITTAVAAVAETGSLLLHPRAGAPMALNFLSDRLVVLVRAADVLRNLEDLWTRTRLIFGSEMPRALCLVSGPSSSGDIGMQFANGVHGPIELHALIVGDHDPQATG